MNDLACLIVGVGAFLLVLWIATAEDGSEAVAEMEAALDNEEE